MTGITLSRRHMIAVNFTALSALAAAAAPAQSPAGPITQTKAIHQEEDFPAGPQRIYEILLDAKLFRTFSGGAAAEINPVAGGAFSLFAGHIVGRNLEMVTNTRIVQAWRAASWPEGVYSIARFELKRQGPGTRLFLDHTGFPSEFAEHLHSGWQTNYWKPLRKFLG